MSSPSKLELIRGEPPVGPRIDGYAERSAADLCASELRISPMRVGVAVAAGRVFIKEVVTTDDDLNRYREYAHGATVNVPNHNDFLDIVAMGLFRELAGTDYPRFVGKASLPASLGKLGLLPVDRSREADPMWGRKLTEIAAHTLVVERRSIVIFGEGTVYPDDDIVHKLEQGLSVLARRNKVPIVPIGIYGTAHGLSDISPPVDIKASMKKILELARHRRRVAICVGEAIHTTQDWYDENGIVIPRKSREFGKFILDSTRTSMQFQQDRARELLAS